DTDIQKKIDHELRMREGACKLLAACTQREQALEATKSLLVCNSRIMAYMSELQRMKEAQVVQRTARRPSDAGPMDDRLPCRGKVCVSGKWVGCAHGWGAGAAGLQGGETKLPHRVISARAGEVPTPGASLGAPTWDICWGPLGLWDCAARGCG
ncbi:rhotekin-like, partial [Terrapene carolina triunguis]|uniref:rhotekin-like n=1 Tax=Terrapene triunguis TaxID=2587831 RepID=UPI001156ACF7